MFCFLVVVINKAMETEREKLFGSQDKVAVIELTSEDEEDIWYYF